MRHLLFALTLLAASVSLTGPASAQTPDFQWGGALVQGQTIEVRGVNGGIRALASDDGAVRVEATRRGRRSNPESVRLEVVEHAEGVTICAVYPNPPRFSNSNTCSPGGGRVNVQKNDVRVDFVVRIPVGVRFVGKTTNGDIHTEGLGPDVQADTHNGNIVLELPADLNAALHANTRKGRIDSDFPITVTGRLDRRNLTGTIGGGGPDLRVSTVNGNIRLWRRAS